MHALSSAFLAAAFVLHAVSAAASASTCVDLFRTAAQIARASVKGLEADHELAKDVMSFEKALGAGNTTSLRREDKYVINQTIAETLIADLSRLHAGSFSMRDERADGEKNVTVTDYAKPILVKLSNGKQVSAKIRLRKYFTVKDDEDLRAEHLRPSQKTATRQYLEVKIDHPVYDGVVIKPRLLIDDAEVKTLRDPKLFAQERSHLRRHWNGLNPEATHGVVDAFLNTLADLYKQTSTPLQAFAETKYVRDSYSLKIRSTDSSKPDLEVQFTLDRDISVQSKIQKIKAYDNSDVVVEIKVPLAQASLTQNDLADYPALASVRDVKLALSQAHNSAFVPGAGKLSAFRRLVRALVDD